MSRNEVPVLLRQAPRGDSSSQLPARLSRLKEGLKLKQHFLLLAETFQALGDASRVQIIWALSHGELCVGDIADLLVMSQPAISHHLRTLRNLHLVKVRKDGRTSFYALDDEHIERLLHDGIEHVEDLLK